VQNNSVGEGGKKSEPLYIDGENVNWYDYYEKQHVGPQKNKNSTTT
jgi:hypothetical protein